MVKNLSIVDCIDSFVYQCLRQSFRILNIIILDIIFQDTDHLLSNDLIAIFFMLSDETSCI